MLWERGWGAVDSEIKPNSQTSVKAEAQLSLKNRCTPTSDLGLFFLWHGFSVRVMRSGAADNASVLTLPHLRYTSSVNCSHRYFSTIREILHYWKCHCEHWCDCLSVVALLFLYRCAALSITRLLLLQLPPVGRPQSES